MTLHGEQTTTSIRADVLESMDIGVCLLDRQLIVRDWSPLLHRRGVPRETAVGQPINAVLAPLAEDAELLMPRLRTAIAAAFETGQTTRLDPEFTLHFPDPIQPKFQVVVTLLEDREHAALLLKPHCAAEEVRLHYERILDSSPDGIMVIDQQRRIRVFNRACGELLGRNVAEVLRTSCVCGELVNCHAADGTSFATQLCPALELFDGTRTWQVQEMLATNSKGQERWVETTYSGIRDAAGNVKFVVGIIRDVHDRKSLESRLHQTEKLAALGQLTAGIAHEIKNPLAIILGSVEIILDPRRPKEMQVEAAAFIKEEVQRLDHRVRSFLEFARPHPPRPEPVVLNGLIRRTVHTIEAALKNVKVELELSRPEGIVQLDSHQFMQVITNLLLNSTEAMNGEGRILIRSYISGQDVVVELHDNGPGVPPDQRPRIFDPFFTTKAHGTGLGLSIVFQIVAAAGGRVTVSHSNELGGALFTLALPFQSTVTGS